MKVVTLEEQIRHHDALLHNCKNTDENVEPDTRNKISLHVSWCGGRNRTEVFLQGFWVREHYLLKLLEKFTAM